MTVDQKDEAKIFKAFCDENRLNILNQLLAGEKCACELLENMDVVQSALSYHMKILCESGIVNCQQVGKWAHYTISTDGINHAISLLKNYIPNNSD